MAPTVDSSGDPLTIDRYELRYRLATDTIYTVVVIAFGATSYQIVNLPAGSYEAVLEVVDSSGIFSTANNFTWEII